MVNCDPEHSAAGRQRLLSICIPTCNRCDCLQVALDSIVDQPFFSAGDEVEIVISDNASTDGTAALCRRYCERFPDKIRFSRLETGIDPHGNFLRAMQLGAGRFIKLHNDVSVFCPGQLEPYVEKIRTHQDRYSIFLYDGINRRTEATFPVADVSELLDALSFLITSISSICLKRELIGPGAACFQNAPDDVRYNFPHVAMIFDLIGRGERALVIVPHYFGGMVGRAKYRGRNEVRIFGVNYLGVLKHYVESGLLSPASYRREKRRVLFRHIIPFHFDFFHQYFEDRPTGYWKYTTAYRRDWYFYLSFPYIWGYYFCSNVIPIHQLLGGCKRKIQAMRAARSKS